MTVRHALPNTDDILISFDPGETTGFVVSRYIGGKSFGILVYGSFQLADSPSTLLSLFARFLPDFVIYERFMLYPNKAKALAYNEFPSCEVIGQIKFMLHNYGIDSNYVAVYNAADRLNTSLADEHKYYTLPEHVIDAYLHMSLFVNICHSRRSKHENA